MTNNNTLQVILVIAIVLINGAYGFEKRCYHDDNDDADVYTLVMSAQFFTGDVMQIIALNGISNAPTNCKSEVTGSINELVIKYKISSATQTTPNPSTNDCFATYSAATFSVKVAVQGNPDFVTITDRLYEVHCNTNAADLGFQNLSGMHIAYVPTINAAVTRKDKVTVQLIKVGGTGSGFPVKNPVLLGGRVRVRMTYTLDLAATAGEYPIGLHNFDLTVGPGNGESGRVQLITDNGCVPSTPNPFGLTQTFAYNRRLSNTGTRRVFETGPFRIAMFATTTSKQLNFKVRYMAECYNLNEQKCFNQTNYCTTLRNKRATDDGGNTTLSFYIQIAMPGEALMKQDIGSVNNIHAQECVADNTYWILAVVLGFILLIVTMVAMFVLCRLRTE